MSVSPKAMKRAETAKSPSYYFNLKSFKKNLDKNDVPWTPAITLVVGLLKSLKMMKAEGMEVIWQRHARLAAATREAMRALHLTLYAKSPSNAVTAVSVPEGMDGGKLVKMLRDDLGITFAGGQGHLKGKLFRIAHMGYCNEFDVLVGIGALEQALKNMGYQFTIGEGVKAFQKSFLS